MKTINKSFKTMKEFLEFSKEHPELKEAGLWDREWDNEIYAQFFEKDCPARSCIEVARLPKDVLIEIEAIVAKC